jgi:hypothetical protein
MDANIGPQNKGMSSPCFLIKMYHFVLFSRFRRTRGRTNLTMKFTIFVITLNLSGVSFHFLICMEGLRLFDVAILPGTTARAVIPVLSALLSSLPSNSSVDLRGRTLNLKLILS